MLTPAAGGSWAVNRPARVTQAISQYLPDALHVLDRFTRLDTSPKV